MFAKSVNSLQPEAKKACEATSFTFSVASSNIPSTKAEADPVPEAEVAPA